jgi:hypothetical protein
LHNVDVGFDPNGAAATAVMFIVFVWARGFVALREDGMHDCHAFLG